MILEGTATYDLTAQHFGGIFPSLPVQVEITYDVPANWDPISRTVSMGKLAPQYVRVFVGSAETESLRYRPNGGEVIAELREFVEDVTEKITAWEGVGLTEEDVLETLREEAELRETEDSMRGGDVIVPVRPFDADNCRSHFYDLILELSKRNCPNVAQRVGKEIETWAVKLARAK